MTTQFVLLSVTLILALVNVLWAAVSRNREVGLRYSGGPRDHDAPVPVGIVTGRLQRAQRNLYESLPLFIAAVLIAHAAGHDGPLSLYGAWAFTLARIAYLPLYAIGSKLRSVAWFVAVTGLLMVMAASVVPV